MRGRPGPPPQQGAVAGRWADLMQRLGSGLMVALAGVVALAVGGVPLTIAAAFLIAGLIWELTRITASQRHSSPASRRSKILALLSGVTFLVMSVVPFAWSIALIAIPVAAGGRGTNPRYRGRFVAFAVAFFLSTA